MRSRRRRAALALLGWVVLGSLASASVSRAAPGMAAADALPCHHAPQAPAGDSPSGPARDAATTPCQWVLPLLCCQQPAAAEVGGVQGLALAALCIRLGVPETMGMPSMVPAAVRGATPTSAPPLARSVVLQV